MSYLIKIYFFFSISNILNLLKYSNMININLDKALYYNIIVKNYFFKNLLKKKDKIINILNLLNKKINNFLFFNILNFFLILKKNLFKILKNKKINIFKKNLSKGLKSTGGRNFLGRVCIKGQGLCNCSTKKKYRYLDFFRRINKIGILLKIFYDTNRTGKIGLILYENGLSAYILIQKGLVMHNLIYSGDQSLGHNIKKGYSVLLNNMPLFSIVSN